MTILQSTQLRKLLCVETDLETLNELNERGLISDLCVTTDDVAESDAEKAITELERDQF